VESIVANGKGEGWDKKQDEVQQEKMKQMSSPTLTTAIEVWNRLWQTGKVKDETKNKMKCNKKKWSNHKLQRTKKETIREYLQRTLSGKNQDLQDVEEFGNPFNANKNIYSG
jgi:hypothetical protein